LIRAGIELRVEFGSFAGMANPIVRETRDRPEFGRFRAIRKRESILRYRGMRFPTATAAASACYYTAGDQSGMYARADATSTRRRNREFIEVYARAE